MDNPETGDAITSAVRKEKREGEYIMERFRRKLKEFEEEHGMERGLRQEV